MTSSTSPPPAWSARHDHTHAGPSSHRSDESRELSSSTFDKGPPSSDREMQLKAYGAYGWSDNRKRKPREGGRRRDDEEEEAWLDGSRSYRDAAMDNPHATRSHPSSGNNQGTPSHSDIVDIQEVPSDYPPPKRSRSRSPSRLRYEDRHHTNNSNPSPYLTPTSAVPLGRQYLSPTPASGLTVPTNASTPTGFDHSNGLSPPVSALAPSRTSGRGTSTSPVVQKLVPNSTATSVITTTGKGGKKDALKTGVKRDVPTAHVMKKEDGDACTREDIQHDMLDYIFSDTTACFTIPPLSTPSRELPIPEPSTSDSDDPSIPRLTFAELYAYTLAASPKVTKGLKEALLDLAPGSLPGKSKAGQGKNRKKAKVEESAEGAPADGDELADPEEIENYDGLKEGYMKLCLLVNIGRINTTFAFYPEMRTILRAYHSVPSLQNTVATRKSMQDAPRMKNGLRSCKLKDELHSVPGSLPEVEALLLGGKHPPTTVCNLLFAMATSPDTINDRYFSNYRGVIDCLNIFCPQHIPSSQRGRVFLWLMFHFLEHHDRRNPFGDEPDVPPKLDIMQPEEYAELKENIDTEEEMDWGELMREGRMQFLTNLANGTAVTGKVFPNSELKDFASKAERAERLEAGLPVGPAKGDGPVPMSVARVKDAQAIVSRKLKRNIELQSPSAYDEAPRKKRRPNGLASSPARHSTAYSPAEAASPDPLEGGLVLPRIDTRGIPEDRLEALRRQADIELGPSPLPSPEISWRDFEPELKPFVFPEDLRLPPPRSGDVSPARSRSSILGSEAAGTEHAGGGAVSASSGPARSSPSFAERSHPPDRFAPATSPRSEYLSMGPPAPTDRGKSIMSLLN